MATIDTLRPTAVITSSGWTATPSGTLNGVTSDNSDSTYALWSGSGSAMVLSVGGHAVPPNHQRHLARVRARARNGQFLVNVRNPSGTNVALTSMPFTSTISSQNGSWDSGIPLSASGVFGVRVTQQVGTVEVMELYVDIDSRERPSFTLGIQDGSTPTTSITGTATPTATFSSISLDNLPAREWRVWVTSGSTIVWDSGIRAGAPTNIDTGTLSNGSYELNAQIWTTIGGSVAYASDVETVAFTVNLISVTAPDAIFVQELDNTPFYLLNVLIPVSLPTYDSGSIRIEFQRIDCNGITTISVQGPVLVNSSISYIDWRAPRNHTHDGCTSPHSDCEFSWRARLFGTVNGLLVTSSFVTTGTYVLNWPTSDTLLRTLDGDTPRWASVCGTINWSVDRPYTSQQGLEGTIFVSSGSVGGKNYTLSGAVRSENDIQNLEEVYDQALVLVSPYDTEEIWSAPITMGFEPIKIGRLRTVSLGFIGTGPEPEPVVEV